MTPAIWIALAVLGLGCAAAVRLIVQGEALGWLLLAPLVTAAALIAGAVLTGG